MEGLWLPQHYAQINKYNSAAPTAPLPIGSPPCPRGVVGGLDGGGEASTGIMQIGFRG